MHSEIIRPYEGKLIGNAHHFALRVYIEDTDLGGVVYHSNYLCFLERARSDLLRSLGINQRVALEKGEGIYAVTEVHIRYCRPAKFDDELLIVTRLEALKRASCVLKQSIHRKQETLVEAVVTVAFLTPEGRPTRQPVEWVQRFKDLQTDAA